MKTKALNKQKLDKRFVVGVIVVVIITSIFIILIDMKNIYDYLFTLGFAYFAIKFLYFQFYRDEI